MFRSALIGLLGLSAMALLTSAPAAAARPGCPCKTTQRHAHVPHAMPARVRHHGAVRTHAHVRARPRRQVVRANRIGDPRYYYAAGYGESTHTAPRGSSYAAMAGGGAHRVNAGSWAWRYRGFWRG